MSESAERSPLARDPLPGEADQQMCVIGYAVDLQHLLPLIGDNASDVLVHLFFESRLNQALPALHGKDDLEVNLRVGICHRCDSYLWSVLYEQRQQRQWVQRQRRCTFIARHIQRQALPKTKS